MGVTTYLLPTSDENDCNKTMYFALLLFIILVFHEVGVDMAQVK
jgi:hypothetical protein